ncbi:MAG: tetratricopeptide repeat protein [Armatimonadetes bacterium]|nr:tetratricopeptide repeat protein [Armatimonadota bacterium]
MTSKLLVRTIAAVVRKAITHMITRLLLAVWVGSCLIAPMSVTSAPASRQLRSAGDPEARADSASVSYGQFPDSPLGHFFYYLGQGQQKKARAAFSQIDTFEARYKALSQAVYPFSYPVGTREIVTNCANMVLRSEKDPHRRAAIYRVLCQMSYRLKDTDAALEHAQKAVRLNPNSPWGGFWLAEVYSDRGFYAAEAAARKRELSLFTGSTTDDWLNRASIYAKLALLYRSSFHQPETAIRYHYSQIDATMRLPADEEYRVYRAAACSGAFMNILATMVQDLHDVPRAQQALEWAVAIIPSFPSEPLERDWILSLGLRLPPAETPSK